MTNLAQAAPATVQTTLRCPRPFLRLVKDAAFEQNETVNDFALKALAERLKKLGKVA